MSNALQLSRTPERDDLRFDYFRLGLGYYIAGRAAYHAPAIPVAGNILHHAIEMFMKGYLVGVGVDEEGRRNLSHKLSKIWEAVRAHVRDPGLDAFTKTIAELDAFEELRYPEAAREKYSFVGILMGPEVAQPAESIFLTESTRPSQAFHCDIDEIDPLVTALFRLGSVNPQALVIGIRNDGLEALRKRNSQAAIWSSPASGTPVTVEQD